MQLGNGVQISNIIFLFLSFRTAAVLVLGTAIIPLTCMYASF